MKLKWPKRLRGTGKSLVWLNNLLDCAKQCEPQPGQDHRIVPAPAGGFRMENIIRPTAMVALESGSLKPRGGWSEGETYKTFDMVFTFQEGDGFSDGYLSAWYWDGETSSTTARPNLAAAESQTQSLPGGGDGTPDFTDGLIRNGNWVLISNTEWAPGATFSATFTAWDEAGQIWRYYRFYRGRLEAVGIAAQQLPH